MLRERSWDVGDEEALLDGKYRCGATSRMTCEYRLRTGHKIIDRFLIVSVSVPAPGVALERL